MSRVFQIPHLAGLKSMPEGWRNAVVAIGNFDGVHSGHQAVLAKARTEAGHIGALLVMMTFEPHPRTFFVPQKPVFRLTDAIVKTAVSSAAGVDGVLVLPFDADLAAMGADDFVGKILLEQLAIRHAVTGYDFHFGHNRLGTPEFLRNAGAQHGFGVTIVAEHGDESGAVSSSRIRGALTDGAVAEAREMLAWTWSVAGEIRHGEKRGRDLGYPTANMVPDPACDLRHGIYAVRFTRENGTVHDGVASFGRRPTFDNGRPLLETYLFDFDGDLYGETALVSLVDWIRPELKFETVKDLVDQMDKDCISARTCLRGSPAVRLDSRVRKAWLRLAADRVRNDEYL
jgi:riboflavin kinase/FMN adenylyltransferase